MTKEEMERLTVALLQLMKSWEEHLKATRGRWFWSDGHWCREASSVTIFKRKVGWLWPRELDLSENGGRFELWVMEGREAHGLDLSKTQLAEVLGHFYVKRKEPLLVTVPLGPGAWQEVYFRKWTLPIMHELANLLLDKPRIVREPEGPYR